MRFTLGSGATALFGCGTIEQIAEVVTGLGEDRAFLVTDQGVAATGVLDEVERYFSARRVATTTFDAVHPNPTTLHVEAGAQFIRGCGRGAVVAVGGGSVLDIGKAMALMAVNEGGARDFEYRHQPARPGLPVIAVPTTAGTGSETNGFGVIEDPDAERKFYIGHASVVPRMAILDPRLTRGLPAGPTAASGMDALAHALESLSSKRCNPYADGLALQAVRMVSRFLPRSVTDGQDLEARGQMLLAAHLAGLAFGTTGLGMGHALAHALSAHLGVAHGVALAALLPHVLRFNLPIRTETYARVAWPMGVSDSHRGDGAKAEAAIEAIHRLSLDVGLPGSLHELGCTETLIPALVEDALADEVIANTPRTPSGDELQALLRTAL